MHEHFRENRVAAGLFLGQEAKVLAVLCLAPPVFQFLGKMVRTVCSEENDPISPAGDGGSFASE